MREIKFRGISMLDGHHALKGGFVFGSYVKDYDSHIFGKCDVILFTGEDGEGRRYPIEKDSVEQYAGLKDKNGKEIYEGDVLNGFQYPYLCDGKHNYIAEVVFFDDSPAFGLCTRLAKNASVSGISDGECDYMSDWEARQWEVIGNIHENPELLEAEHE